MRVTSILSSPPTDGGYCYSLDDAGHHDESVESSIPSSPNSFSSGSDSTIDTALPIISDDELQQQLSIPDINLLHSQEARNGGKHSNAEAWRRLELGIIIDVLANDLPAEFQAIVASRGGQHEKSIAASRYRQKPSKNAKLLYLLVWCSMMKEHLRTGREVNFDSSSDSDELLAFIYKETDRYEVLLREKTTKEYYAPKPPKSKSRLGSILRANLIW